MKKPDIDMQSKRMMVETKAYSEMIDALIQAKETIRTWHGEVAWDLYQHSPEMKKINNALQKAGVTDL